MSSARPGPRPPASRPPALAVRVDAAWTWAMALAPCGGLGTHRTEPGTRGPGPRELGVWSGTNEWSTLSRPGAHVVTESVQAARPHGGGPRLPRESEPSGRGAGSSSPLTGPEPREAGEGSLKGGSADEEARDSPGQWAPPDPAFVHWPPAPCAGSAPRFTDGRPSSTPLRHAAGSTSSQLDFCAKTPGAPSHTSPLSVTPTKLASRWPLPCCPVSLWHFPPSSDPDLTPAPNSTPAPLSPSQHRGHFPGEV